MVKEKPIYEFFKRKRDDPIVDREEPPVLAPLIGLEQIQDEEQQSVRPAVFRGLEFLE